MCLVADEGGISANMERVLQRLGRDKQPPPSQRILEINAEHPVIVAVEKIVAQNKNDARLEPWCRLLYDQALITEGSRVQDPLAFAKRVNELLLKDVHV